MPTTFTPERENLFRGLPGGLELRAESDDANAYTMAGHFCVFNDWTEISSWYEGNFLERIAPGAARKTIARILSTTAPDRSVVQYDHGYDTYIGSAPLGVIDVLREDETGCYYEVPLLDTDYNAERVLPMLQGRLMSGTQRGSVLGASFRFQVLAEEWNDEPAPSEHNPKGLPERTITEFRLFEFGPVVFPAYPSATAGMRSLTDHYLERRREARSQMSAAPAVSPAADDTPDPALLPSGSDMRQAVLRAQALVATRNRTTRSTTP